MKYLDFLIISLMIIGIFFEVLSFLLFEGLFADLNFVCGSACEIWPGIPISDVCILVCMPRNGYYTLFFILGVFIIIFGVSLLIYKLKFVRV
jgi:hypothetical protein